MDQVIDFQMGNTVCHRSWWGRMEGGEGVLSSRSLLRGHTGAARGPAGAQEARGDRASNLPPLARRFSWTLPLASSMTSTTLWAILFMRLWEQNEGRSEPDTAPQVLSSSGGGKRSGAALGDSSGNCRKGPHVLTASEPEFPLLGNELKETDREKKADPLEFQHKKLPCAASPGHPPRHRQDTLLGTAGTPSVPPPGHPVCHRQDTGEPAPREVPPSGLTAEGTVPAAIPSPGSPCGPGCTVSAVVEPGVYCHAAWKTNQNQTHTESGVPPWELIFLRQLFPRTIRHRRWNGEREPRVSRRSPGAQTASGAGGLPQQGSACGQGEVWAAFISSLWPQSS